MLKLPNIEFGTSLDLSCQRCVLYFCWLVLFQGVFFSVVEVFIAGPVCIHVTCFFLYMLQGMPNTHQSTHVWKHGSQSVLWETQSQKHFARLEKFSYEP